MSNKWLFFIFFCFLSLINTAQAENKVAIVNIGSLFQQMAKKTGIFSMLEEEFKGRVGELQQMENSLQNKIHHFDQNGRNMKDAERKKLEKEIIEQRHFFSQKARSFQQDHQFRSDEEREKLVFQIQEAIKKIAIEYSFDLVIDTNAIAFNSNSIKDITDDVFKNLQ